MIDTAKLRAEIAAWITAGGDVTGRPHLQPSTLPAVFVGRPVRIAPLTGGLDELVLELVVAVGNPADPATQDRVVELAIKVADRFRPGVVDLSQFTAARSIRFTEIGDFEESTLNGAAVLTATPLLTILA